jgi:hypothetical protein
MLHSALPHFPDAPALRVLLSQLTHYTTSFVRLGFGFRTHLPPLLEDAVSARVSSEFSRAVEDLVRTSGMGWYVVGASREVPRGTAAGVLHYALTGAGRLSPPCGTTNALLAASNGLRLLAPAALQGDPARALDASLTKALVR